MLLLIRHAHAVAATEQERRPLSDRGRDEVARLIAFLRTARGPADAGDGAFAPVHIWHSPLARSFETAQPLHAALAPEASLVEIPGLLPEDDPAIVADRLELMTTPLAVVGHEPHLGALATLLVRGKKHPGLFTLKKAAVLALERTGATHKKTGRARWAVRWMLQPELLPARVTPPAPVPEAPGWLRLPG